VGRAALTHLALTLNRTPHLVRLTLSRLTLSTLLLALSTPLLLTLLMPCLAL
jgi:hypothetical protein